MVPVIDPGVSDYYIGDCRKLLRRLPTGCVQVCVTSPPFWGLRSYLDEDDPLKSLEIGAEDTPDQYVDTLVAVFAEVRRVLADDGTLWLNLGDSYSHGGSGSRDKGRWPKQSRNDHMPRRKKRAGIKPKDLIGIPWETAFALRHDGWWLRGDNIWAKPNPMPEPVTDRCTRAHEYMFHLTKSESYYYNHEAIAEPAINAGRTVSLGEQSFVRRQAIGAGKTPSGNGNADEYEVGDTRNKRSVWTVAHQPYEGAHFATFPPDLIEPCILASSRPGDLVLDPFFGSGTTGEVAEKHGRRWIGFDLNRNYAELAKWRTAQRTLPLTSR